MSIDDEPRKEPDPEAPARRVSGPGQPVDHDRQPGVPPPANDDYDDKVDLDGAESFPASDPPSGW